MTNLYISIYNEPNPDRWAELMICLNINIKNKNIDRIVIITECELALKFKKIKLIKVSKRPTFNDIFEIINKLTDHDDINIVANSDIYFTDLPKLPDHHECYALTRYDINNGEAKFFNRRDSQDVWIVRGFVKQIDADFTLGYPGCDNKISFLLRQSGYFMSNPSLTIRTYHLHSDTNRNWHGLTPLEEPYLLLPPCQ